MQYSSLDTPNTALHPTSFNNQAAPNKSQIFPGNMPLSIRKEPLPPSKLHQYSSSTTTSTTLITTPLSRNNQPLEIPSFSRPDTRRKSSIESLHSGVAPRYSQEGFNSKPMKPGVSTGE